VELQAKKLTKNNDAWMQDLSPIFVFLVISWTWPFAIGPSPSVMPWLATLGCGVLVAFTLASRALSGRALVLALLGAAVLSSGLGLLQFFNATLWLEPWVNASPNGEVFGNLRQRNQFASLMNIGVLALLALLALRGAARNWEGAGAVLLAVLLGAANALALSRTGFIQLLVVLGLAWAWALRGGARAVDSGLRKRWGLVLAAAVLAYSAVSLGLAVTDGERSVLGRFAGDAPACSSRLTLWSNVLHLIAQKPWLGWGWGHLDYAHFITLYDGERFCDILDNAHNLPLHLAVELGVPLALAFCGWVCWAVWRGKPWLESHPSRQMAWGVLILIGLHSLLEYPLWYGPFLLTALLCVWLLWALPRDGFWATAAEGGFEAEFEPNKADAAVKWTSLAIKIIAITVLIATAYAAWDYRRVSQIYLQPEQRAPEYADNTLAKIQGSWLFAPQVRFAQLMLTPITKDNAVAMRDLAQHMLYYSPEPRVVEKRIEASALLGQDDEVLFYALRLKRAFPDAYADWVEKNAAVAARLTAPPAGAAQ
jgi:O-antigen ligase